MAYARLIGPGSKIKLKDFDPAGTFGLQKTDAEKKTQELIDELISLQEILYAAKKNSVLIVLQGCDTSGKDGTIRNVLGPLNAQGCNAVSFKVPTTEELDHDFLWRVHKNVPSMGNITVFNRSHYEDVLVVRVNKLLPEKVWRSRYLHINNFEQLLSENNTIIFKFYLHISKEEQYERLIAREQDRNKYWKLSVGDWQNRELWDDYTAAYEDAINHCSTPYAPWYIVPADKKWFRNLAILETIVNTLKPYKKGWIKQLEQIGRKEIEALNKYRNGLDTDL